MYINVRYRKQLFGILILNFGVFVVAAAAALSVRYLLMLIDAACRVHWASSALVRDAQSSLSAVSWKELLPPKTRRPTDRSLSRAPQNRERSSRSKEARNNRIILS